MSIKTNEMYQRDKNGRLILYAIDPEFSEKEYIIPEGTEVLEQDLFKDYPFIKKLTIPATVCVIPEGTLSNGAGWASDEKGIDQIVLDPGNSHFSFFKDLFCENKKDGSFKLLRYIGNSEKVFLPKCVTEIGSKAFTDRAISCVYVEGIDLSIWFPKKHLYYLNVLLDDFGKNGKLYDFSTYDRFLFENHFNDERIRMTCERLNHPFDLSDENRKKLKTNLIENEENVLEALVKSQGMEIVEELESVGFFTAENIDRIMEYINHSQREDLLSWLMNYKHERYGVTEFDFEI